LTDQSAAAVWQLVRQSPGLARHDATGSVVGLDAVAALALGEARGIEAAAVAIWLPPIEAGLLAACRKREG